MRPTPKTHLGDQSRIAASNFRPSVDNLPHCSLDPQLDDERHALATDLEELAAKLAEFDPADSRRYSQGVGDNFDSVLSVTGNRDRLLLIFGEFMLDYCWR